MYSYNYSFKSDDAISPREDNKDNNNEGDFDNKSKQKLESIGELNNEKSNHED